MWPLDAGVRAAMQLGNPEEVSFFIESLRSGELRESLGGADALLEAVLPSALIDLEKQARAEILRSRAALRRLMAKGKRKEIAEARKSLEQAEAAYLETVGRIQREAKAAGA